MQPVILICFFLSGISGLVLEVIWTRMLEHIFGATTLAISTVLACFMGGLALGSWLFGRLSDKMRSPLMGYAIAEGIVGVAAFAIPYLIESFYPGLNRWMVAHLSNNFWLLSVARFVAVAAVLLIPTTCMGATLPLLSRYVISHKGHMARVGSRIGALYTVNTIGAVSGVFLATFALLPTIGLMATNRVAGTLNLVLCAALVAGHRWLVAKHDLREDVVDVDLEIAEAIEGVRRFVTTKPQRFAALLAFFMSGLASMNLQVVWNRAMAMVIGASVYSFSLVLIAFLVGLALGSAVFSKLSKRVANPVLILALVELAVAGLAMANYLYMDDLPRIFAVLVTSQVHSFSEHVGLIQFLMFIIAALAVFPATFFMGATFPLTVRVVTHGIGQVGRDVGGVYALNTLGAICGSFLSAFVFVPLFSRYFNGAGMQTTFYLSVAIYAILGLALLAVSQVARTIRLGVAVPAAALVLAFLFGSPAWDPASMTIGVFRLSLMRDALDEEAWGDPDVKYYYDGVCTTVSVELWGRHFALKNNGKVDASNGDDMPTQIMVSAVPLLLHPKGPKDLDVAIIGFGSGVTVGSALQFPIRHVDVVELENAVIEASRVFGAVEGEVSDPEFDVNHLLYRNPVNPQDGTPNPAFDWNDPNSYLLNDRISLFNNDGRNFLASSSKKYDVIVSEPSNPWITGVSNMFTQDNFTTAVNALKQDGVFCQWVQLYELSPDNIKTILRTFASVFPHVVLFSSEDLSSDTMLLGSFEPIEFNLARVEKALEYPDVRAELERAYIFSATDVFARVLLVNRRELMRYTNGPAGEAETDLPINTDDNALIEFAAPQDLISFASFAGYLATIYTSEWSFGRLRRVITGLGSGVEEARNLADQAISLLRNGRKNEAATFLESAQELAAEDPMVERAAQIASLLRGHGGPSLPDVEKPQPSPSMTGAQLKQLEEQVARVRESLELKAPRDALERFEEIPEHLWRRGGPQMLLLRGYVHYLNADAEDGEACEESIEILGQLIREHEVYVAGHPEIFYYLALCHDNALHFDKAVKNVQAYVELNTRREERAQLVLAQTSANLEATLEGIRGTMPIPLPADPLNAPSTDSQGEAPKIFHLN